MSMISGRLIMQIDERGVFVDEPGDRAGQLHVVLAVLHLQGESVDGRGRRRRRLRDILDAAARIASQCVARRCVFQMAEGQSIAFNGFGSLGGRAAKQAREAGNLFLAARRKHGLAVDKCSPQHARK